MATSTNTYHRINITAFVPANLGDQNWARELCLDTLEAPGPEIKFISITGSATLEVDVETFSEALASTTHLEEDDHVCKVGDAVEVMSGPYAGHSGTVVEITEKAEARVRFLGQSGGSVPIDPIDLCKI